MFAPESPKFVTLASRTRTVTGMSTLMDDFDAFILDQWGVLHDGHTPYPGAIDCLQRIKNTGKMVVILSNSGKRGEDNAQLIVRMGFARELFAEVVCAGDDARDAILHDPDPFYRSLGPRCLPFTRADDLHLAEGLGRQLVTDVEQADFLLVLSMDSAVQSLAHWEPVLQRARDRDLPMVCGNPDLARVSPSGELFEAPGLLAKRYAALGGAVRIHGKPNARIYNTCLRALPYPRQRIAGVGDSLLHDVLGASGVGLPSIFVASGVHQEELRIRFGETPESDTCAKVYAQHGATPDCLVPSFRW